MGCNMSEATEYLIKNITKTYEIYNEICRMETEVLEKVDKNIRESFSNWVEGNWIATEDENLHEDFVELFFLLCVFCQMVYFFSHLLSNILAEAFFCMLYFKLIANCPVSGFCGGH